MYIEMISAKNNYLSYSNLKMVAKQWTDIFLNTYVTSNRREINYVLYVVYILFIEINFINYLFFYYIKTYSIIDKKKI